MRYRLIFLLITGLLLSDKANGQTGSEIFVFDFKIWYDQYSLSNPRNVTLNPGFYDNQPHFLPDGERFLYSSADDTGKTDVYMFNLRGMNSVRMTYTPEFSEYSPTPTLDKKGFSCIILEEDGTQKLWKYILNAPVSSLIMDVENVGYHAWYDEDRLVAFIVGEPNTLYWVDIESGETKEITKDIGRSLQRIPGQEKVSFIDLKPNHHWTIKSVDINTFEITTIIEAPNSEGFQDFTWTNDGTLLMGDGQKLFKFNPGSDQSWVELADLQKYGVGQFNRIAVNPQTSKLAVVVDE